MRTVESLPPQSRERSSAAVARAPWVLFRSDERSAMAANAGTDSVAPAVVDRGPGSPEVAVVAGIHGDEPSGVRAVRGFLGDDPALERGVRFVVANPAAYIADERYLDADLNRVFPGTAGADDRERRLAPQVCAATEGLPTLSLHATHSQSEPIALVDLEEDVADLAAALPVPYVVDETNAVDGAFTTCSSVITLEAGCQHTAAATETATEGIRAFLALTDALEEPVPGDDSDTAPEFFTLEGSVEKPSGESYSLRAENFERVPAGARFASAGGEDLVADEPFVPVLMSECGYQDVFGYWGRRLGDSLAEARDALADG